MALRSADDYIAGLVDDRRVHYRGATIGDVTAEPDLLICLERATGKERWRKAH